jgi:hydroxymethylglutaryl-CoA synthase
MVGITAAGMYIPIYRLSRDEIARIWGSRSTGGTKAVAGYDEDTVTMAVASVIECLKQSEVEAGGLSLATTTAPYREKQSAAIIASVADLGKECHTGDFSGSLRAATIALKSALDAVKAGSAKNILVTAADCRLGAAKGMLEQALGDGAATLMIGSDNVAVEIEGSYSVFNDFTDLWRAEEDTYVRTTEQRFIDEVGYLPTMQEAINGLLEKYKLTLQDFLKIVYNAGDARQHAALARRMKLDKAQVQEPLYDKIGNTGTAAAFLMLVAALETAKPNDRILLAGYGDGCDAFILRATDNIGKIQGKSNLNGKLEGKITINYGQYLTWKELVRMEASTLPERSAISLPSRWRERRAIAALYGVKCRQCGTPQINQIGQATRVCVHCQAKDDFEDYKFSDKKGKLFSYAIDQLQPTQNPPGVNGVIDFDEGGRIICELTDCEIDKVAVGMPVEMTFRKMFQSRGINNYFWKAKPVVEW